MKYPEKKKIRIAQQDMRPTEIDMAVYPFVVNMIWGLVAISY